MGLLVEKPWPTSPEIGVKFGFVAKYPLEEMVLSIARFLGQCVSSTVIADLYGRALIGRFQSMD